MTMKRFMCCVLLYTFGLFGFQAPAKQLPKSPSQVELECSIEVVPNPDLLVFHLNRQVSTHVVFSDAWDLPREEKAAQVKEPALLHRLMETEGVARVTFSQNEVHLERGLVFTWEEIVPRVLSVLSEEFNGGNKLGLKGGIPKDLPASEDFHKHDQLRWLIVRTIWSNEVWLHTDRRVSKSRVGKLVGLNKEPQSALYQRLSALPGMREIEFNGYEIKITSGYKTDVYHMVAQVIIILAERQMVA